MTFGGDYGNKKDREYHTLSVSDTLSTCQENDAESMTLSVHHADTLRLSAPHAEAHAESISVVR